MVRFENMHEERFGTSPRMLTIVMEPANQGPIQAESWKKFSNLSLARSIKFAFQSGLI